MASLDCNLNPNISPDSPTPKKIVVLVISDLTSKEISRILEYLTLMSIILGHDHDNEKKHLNRWVD